VALVTAPVAAKAAGLYMICTISKHAAEQDGYSDAMMLDYRGYVAESTGSNVFFVQDGALVTPTPDCFLDGLTRQTVVALARSKGFEVIEFDRNDDDFARRMGQALGWDRGDQPMDLQNDLFALYTILRRK
jgi:branched-subunit amino acid aminotransferase/4-amino-4-deoxychorismate lyase